MRDRDTVHRGYDAAAEAYAETRTSRERDARILAGFLDAAPAGRVLDAGCGHGEPVLRALADRPAVDAVGLDFSRAQVENAAATAPSASLLHGDMVALPFDADAFAAVVAVDALIHVPRDQRPAVLGEFTRVLRPGGRVLVSEASSERDRTTQNWLDAGVEMTWEMAGAAATRRHLRDAGFTIVREWDAPATTDGPPEPPFFAGVLAD